MDEILQQLEASLGVSAGLLERSAAARAGVSGTSAEAVVRGWGGEEVAGAEPPAEAAPADVAAPEAAPEPAAAPPSAAVPVEETQSVAVAEEPVATETAPEPEEPAESESESERESAGMLAGFPAWLSAALVLIPMVALAYVLIAPNGPGCGSSGQLAIDPEQGVAENCDGTEYGVETISFFTIGEELYFQGSPACAVCHGDDGGGGTGPAMSGGAILVTFPVGSCSDHLKWVELGSAGWPDDTYGENGTALAGNMPGFGDGLTPEELAAVVIYERVQFGGQTLGDAEADCGTEVFELADG